MLSLFSGRSSHDLRNQQKKQDDQQNTRSCRIDKNLSLRLLFQPKDFIFIRQGPNVFSHWSSALTARVKMLTKQRGDFVNDRVDLVGIQPLGQSLKTVRPKRKIFFFFFFGCSSRIFSPVACKLIPSFQ